MGYGNAIKRLWQMPRWMEPFRHLFNHLGRYSVEDLMNSDAEEASDNHGKTLSLVSVSSQVELLTKLARRGMLVGVKAAEVLIEEAEQRKADGGVAAVKKGDNGGTTTTRNVA